MPLQAKVSERYSRTKAALDSFYDTGETSEWHGEGYRIMPGQLGAIPENLERGTVML